MFIKTGTSYFSQLNQAFKMKKLIYIMMLCLSLAAFAQDDFIMKKDGTKIIVDPETVVIMQFDERIGYKAPGRNRREHVKYKDLAYVAIDGMRYRLGYYMIAENEEVVMGTAERVFVNPEATCLYYRIIDKKTEKTIKSGTLKDTDTGTKEIDAAIELARQYFSECPTVMEKINGTLEERKAFFWDRIYIECN